MADAAARRVRRIRDSARVRPWRTVEDVGLSALGGVDWQTHRRLGCLGDVPPTEGERKFQLTPQGT